jgi:hypothetical protein
MTGQEHNVGFLATESGVKQFQPCLGESFVLRCRRFFPELRPLYYTTELERQTSVWTLFDQVAGAGGIISYTNPWTDPVGFYSLDVSVSPGP